MERTELEAEGEALRRTLERIDFLLNQGFISEEDAACRKQGAMNDFCLAPMIDRRRRQTQADKVAFGAGKDGIGLADGGNIASLPAVAAVDGAGGAGSCAGLSAADSDSPTCWLNSGSTGSSGSSEVHAESGDLPPDRASGTGAGSNPDLDGKQWKRPQLGAIAEVRAVESEQLLAAETSGLLRASTRGCGAPGCHLLSTCGHAEGSGSVRVCAQNRSPEMPNDIPLFAPAGPEGPVDPERPEDSKGPERQQGPDGTNLLKVPDVPMQAQPQSQPQPQPEPQPQRHAQPPTTTRESCNTDLAARSNSVISINSSSDLSMERPTEPRLLLLVPEANDTTTVSSTVSSTVDSVAVATDAEAVSLAPAAPGLLAATNPTQNSPVRVSDSTALVSATSCEGISSTESGGVSTACGGVSSRSKPLPEETIPTPMQMPMQMMQMPMQMNMQMPSVEAEPPPPTVPISADMKRGSCEWRECLKEPHYAVKGQRARTCFGHKEEDWVHVSRRRCDKDDCPRGAYFSLQGSTAIFCSAHRTPDMVDVVNLRRYKCHTEDCQRQAYYNFLGLSRSKAKFCSTHKLPDMLNVRHRLCENDGCRTTPTYSFAGDRPRFCASHKTEAMVDTKSKTCAYVDLNGLPCLKCRLYGLEDGKATFCFAHKSDGMINIRQARKRKSV